MEKDSTDHIVAVTAFACVVMVCATGLVKVAQANAMVKLAKIAAETRQ